MEGQAPPLGGVAADPPAVAGELHAPPPPPPPPPLPLEVGDAPPFGTDGEVPSLDAVAPKAPAVAGELHPPPPLVEDAPLLGMEGQAVAPEAPTVVVGDLPPSPPSLGVEEDALPVVPDATSPEDVSGGVVLTDELRDQIVKQVEYYFSDENLPSDEFMLKFVKKNKEGFVPIGVIASFRRMKKLVQDLSIIEAALRTSSKLVVNSDGKRVRRLHPLPHNEVKDAKKSTVVVENLPPDFSMESIQEKFGTLGKILNVTIHDPHSVKESATPKKADLVLSNKVHALVEYEAVDAAEKAVATLNDERNWRSGMKVRLLAKRSVTGSGKQNQSSKENLDSVSKKNNRNQPSKKEQHTTSEKNSSADSVGDATDKENLNSVLAPEDEQQYQKPNAKGGRKPWWYKGQPKGQVQIEYYPNRQGCSGSASLMKPIPGPRMPDGTRGFTTGRGQPIPPQKAEKAEE